MAIGSSSPSLRSRIESFLVMDVMEETQKMESMGRDVIHLEVGQPGTPAPRGVIDAAHAALDADPLGYTVARGLPLLRDKISDHYRAMYRSHVDPDDIHVTQGASGAVTLAFLAGFDPGARIVTTRPGYPCYRNIIKTLDLTPVEIPVGPETGYQLTAEHLRRVSPSPQGVILASPSNPTGSILSEDRLIEICAYCDERGIMVIVDEIYHGLCYAEAHPPTALACGKNPFVIGSFSKYFSMTGWRLGWMIAPPSYRRTLEILTQNLAICASTLAQRAAIHAFDCHDELKGHVERYRTNRDILISALRQSGITEMAPSTGAFYLYVDVSPFTDDSRKFCARLLEETGVATTSGVDFDPVDGRKMMRLSYCGATQDVERAALRLVDYFRSPVPKAT